MDDRKKSKKTASFHDGAPALKKDENGLFLEWNGMLLRADFRDMIPRLLPGRLESELIVKASGILKTQAFEKRSDGMSAFSEDEICVDGICESGALVPPLAIDATAGLGEDSLLLAAAGFRVVMYEKNEIIFELLKDAIERALNLPDDEEFCILKSAVSRMEVHNEDSILAMRSLSVKNGSESSSPGTAVSSSIPSVVFLDPMFPSRRKTSLVGKKLQILQQLEIPCENETELLDSAMLLNPKRIIIKRPPKGPYLGGIKPTFSLGGKSVRIDCIAFSCTHTSLYV